MLPFISHCMSWSSNVDSCPMNQPVAPMNQPNAWMLRHSIEWLNFTVVRIGCGLRHRMLGLMPMYWNITSIGLQIKMELGFQMASVCLTIFFFKFCPNSWECRVLALGPAKQCLLQRHQWHYPSLARFFGGNLDRKFNVSQVENGTVLTGLACHSVPSCQLV